MTLIIGVKDKNTGIITMACDSCVSYETNSRIAIKSNKTPKIFKMDIPGDGMNNTHMLIGVSGYPRMGDIIKYYMDIPSYRGEEPRKWFVTRFIPRMRVAISENGYMGKSDSGSEEVESSLLLAFMGSLYYVETNMQVGEDESSFYAIGGGAVYALSALKTMELTMKKPCPDMSDITMAFDVTEKMYAYCKPPYHYFSI